MIRGDGAYEEVMMKLRSWFRVGGFCLVFCGGVSSSLCDSGGPFWFSWSNSNGKIGEWSIQDHSADLLFYVKNEPELIFEEGVFEPSEIGWKPREESQPILRYLGNLGRKRIYSVRYVKEETLKRGSMAAYGIVILWQGEENDQFRPVYYVTGGATENFEATDVFSVGELTLIQLTTYYSGQGSHRNEIFLRAMDGKVVSHGLWGDTSKVWKEVKELGYEPWHRGYSRSVSKMRSYQHIHLPSENNPDGKYPHRWLRIDYELKGEMLEVAGWEIVDEPED